MTRQTSEDRHIAENIQSVVEYLRAHFQDAEINAGPDDQPLMHAFAVRLRFGEQLRLRMRVSLLADKENSGSYIHGLLSRADVAKQLRENKTWDL